MICSITDHTYRQIDPINLFAHHSYAHMFGDVSTRRVSRHDREHSAQGLTLRSLFDLLLMSYVYVQLYVI
jgi:hypothetical protein